MLNPVVDELSYQRTQVSQRVVGVGRHVAAGVHVTATVQFHVDGHRRSLERLAMRQDGLALVRVDALDAGDVQVHDGENAFGRQRFVSPVWWW